MPTGPLGQVKQLLNQAFDTPLTEQLAAERQAVAASANAREGREGVTAFLDKRQPQYAAAIESAIALPVVGSSPAKSRMSMFARLQQMSSKWRLSWLRVTLRKPALMSS